MPDTVHTVALVTANLVLFAAALAVVVGPVWLLVATIRHRLRAAAQRIAFHAAARDAASNEARVNDSNELLYIDLESTDFDAELLELTKGDSE